MTSAEIQRRILHGLRAHESGITYVDLADEIDQMPTRVRGELRALKARRLIRDQVGHDPAHGTVLLWKLTARGWALIYSGDQMRIV